MGLITMERFRLEPTDGAAVTFEGELLGEWSSETDDNPQRGERMRKHTSYLVLTLYRTAGGKFVAQIRQVDHRMTLAPRVAVVHAPDGLQLGMRLMETDVISWWVDPRSNPRPEQQAAWGRKMDGIWQGWSRLMGKAIKATGFEVPLD